MFPVPCLILLLSFETGWKHEEAERRLLQYPRSTFLPHLSSCFLLFQEILLNPAAFNFLLLQLDLPPKAHAFPTLAQLDQSAASKKSPSFPSMLLCLSCKIVLKVCLLVFVCIIYINTGHIVYAIANKNK